MQEARERVFAACRRNGVCFLEAGTPETSYPGSKRGVRVAKAIDILRVVGLVDEVSDEGAQEIFVRDAFARWRDLTAALPKNSPGRFSHGWYRTDYALEGDIRDIAIGPAAVCGKR